MNLEADALARYEDAKKRLALLKAEWVELGRPSQTSGSKGQWVQHPLLKTIIEHEVIVDRLWQRVRKKHDGPEPSAVIKPPVLTRD